MKAKGMTQGELAEAAGVSINAVSKWTKSGKIARKNLPVVAEKLGFSIDELLAATPAKAPERAEDSRLERLNADEDEIIAMYRDCKPEVRKVVRDQLRLGVASLAGRNQSIRHKP